MNNPNETNYQNIEISTNLFLNDLTPTNYETSNNNEYVFLIALVSTGLILHMINNLIVNNENKGTIVILSLLFVLICCLAF